MICMVCVVGTVMVAGTVEYYIIRLIPVVLATVVASLQGGLPHRAHGAAFPTLPLVVSDHPALERRYRARDADCFHCPSRNH